jgi:leucyl-tRNA synthetase
MAHQKHLPGTGRGTAGEAGGGGGVPHALRLRHAPSTAFGGPPPRTGEVF